MLPEPTQPDPTHLVIPRKAAFSKMGIGSYLEKGILRGNKKKQKTTTKKRTNKQPPDSTEWDLFADA